MGDGAPVELAAVVGPNGELENEYLSAQRFIGEHFETLSSAQHLEERHEGAFLLCIRI